MTRIDADAGARSAGRAMMAGMSGAVVVERGAGEIVGDSPERRVEILSDCDELHATWTRFGPRREGADLHVHHEHTDLFYVLDGELALRLGAGSVAPLPSGTLARVPPNVVHGFRNAADADVRYLNFHAPGRGFADYVRALRDGHPFAYDQHDPPADGGRASAEASIGAAEVVADRPGLRVALLADAETIAIAEVASDAGGPSPPAHVHRRHVESFYVLEGEMTFTAAGRELRAVAGTWVQVPAGVPHTFALTGDGPVRFLDVHTPGCGFGDFARALHRATSDDELAAARAAFDQEPA
jgi:quercetin dioxygenase-like cupin family protein